MTHAVQRVGGTCRSQKRSSCRKSTQKAVTASVQTTHTGSRHRSSRRTRVDIDDSHARGGRVEGRQQGRYAAKCRAVACGGAGVEMTTGCGAPPRGTSTPPGCEVFKYMRSFRTSATSPSLRHPVGELNPPPCPLHHRVANQQQVEPAAVGAPVLVGSAMTGTSTRPATTLARPPSMPVTQMTTSAALIASKFCTILQRDPTQGAQEGESQQRVNRQVMTSRT